MLGEEYNAHSSELCNFLNYPVISSLLAPNIFLNTLFSKTLNLCSSLKVRDQVSQPYSTIGNIIVLKSGRSKNNSGTDNEEEKKLAGPLAKKELPTKGCSRTVVPNPRHACH